MNVQNNMKIPSEYILIQKIQFMKYLKTYEALITLDLDQEELELLMDDAIENDKIKVVESLLKNGFDPNHRNFTKDEPLILTAAYEENIEIVKLLIKYNADLNIIVDDSTIIESILTYCVDSNTLKGITKNLLVHSDVMILLIQSGVNITQKFMEDLNGLKTRHKRISDIAIKLLNRIKEECSEQYKIYKLSLTANKYNL